MQKAVDIQEEILAFLGDCPDKRERVRTMHRIIHPERYGISLWNEAYQILLRSGAIEETGRGTKNDPRMVSLIIPMSATLLKAIIDQMPIIRNLLFSHLAVIRDQYIKTL